MSEFRRSGKQELLTEYFDDESVGEQMAKWQEPQASPESALVAQHDATAMRRLGRAARQKRALRPAQSRRRHCFEKSVLRFNQNRLGSVFFRVMI